MWPSVFPLLAGAVPRMIGGVKTSNSRQAGLGLFRATGIYVGAILGSGILVLPAIAAREAGPASLLAWALLLVFCTPVAFSFAEMSRQQPDAGGIAHFVTRAYGRRASAVAGYLFYFAIPFGAPATAVIGGNYIAHALGGGRGTALVAAALLLAAAFAGNAVGIRMSSGIQLVADGAAGRAAGAGRRPGCTVCQGGKLRAVRAARLLGRGRRCQPAVLLLRRLGGGHTSRRRIPPPGTGPQAGHVAHPDCGGRGLHRCGRRLGRRAGPGPPGQRRADRAAAGKGARRTRGPADRRRRRGADVRSDQHLRRRRQLGWVRAWRPTACCRGRSRGAPVRARCPGPAWGCWPE